MTQIQQHSNALFSGTNGLGAGASATRKDSAGNAANGSPAFAQFLNQSSQKLQTQAAAQAQPQQPPVAAKPSQPQPQAPKAAARPAEGSALQDENKLNARNAARKEASRSADAQKSASRPAATAQKAEGADAAAQSADAKGIRAQVKGEPDAAPSADGTDSAKAQSETDASDKDKTDPAAGTPAQQILALLRGEAPVEARSVAREGSAEGETPTDDGGPLAGNGGGNAHGTRRHDVGAAMQERQQLQRDISQAARGEPEGGERTDALQAAGSSAHEIAIGDNKPAGALPQSFEAMLAAAQQTGGTAEPNGADAPARTEAPNVPLSQPLDSPAFAPELSTSISLLIKDGIQKAQLSLNPAEMGPVSINIQMDGQQAQVNFHAEHAATREVLERSLPDLAAALQGQGLTLTGGGVFAQAQSNSGQNRDDGRSEGGSRHGGRGGSAEDDGITAASRTERRTAPRGIVDLYA